MKTVKVMTNMPGCRPGDFTCSAGTIEFDKNGEAEVSLEIADKLRGMSGLHFSDEEVKFEEIKEVEKVKELKTPVVEEKVLETGSIPGLSDLEPIKGLEDIDKTKKTPVVEEAIKKDEIVEDKKEDPIVEDTKIEEAPENPLNKLTKADLKELCKASNIPSIEYSNLNKESLIKFVVDNKIAE